MPRKKKTDSASSTHSGEMITSIKYSAKRKNIPPAGLEAQGVLREEPRIRYEYNPHLSPVLRSAPDAAETDKLPKLLATARQRALSAEEANLLADALRRHEPWLEWTGKREKPWFEVEPVALHMHERVSTQAILRVLAREDVERTLFADPQQEYAKAVQFYQHDVDWANRMILAGRFDVSDSVVGLGIIAFLVGFVFGHERADKLERISVALVSGLAALPTVGVLIGLSGWKGWCEWLGYLLTWAIGALAALWTDNYCVKYRTSN
jgi:hypothetical protein